MPDLKPALSLLPRSWSREKRSAAAIAAAVAGMLLFLWLVAIPLSRMPEPIGPAAELFAAGARLTVELTVVSGSIGILIGFVVALAKLSRIRLLRWFAMFYIWVLRGTPLIGLKVKPRFCEPSQATPPSALARP